MTPLAALIPVPPLRVPMADLNDGRQRALALSRGDLPPRMPFSVAHRSTPRGLFAVALVGALLCVAGCVVDGPGRPGWCANHPYRCH
jgi:hypothetical protein